MGDAKPDIRAIFCEAMDLESPEEVAQYLDAACGDDAELRAQVEALLSSHRKAGAFLRGPSPAEDAKFIAEGQGTKIGPYKLLQQIGEGGMGIVFMAEQTEPVKRRVALKIIKPGMDTRQVITRFEAERQALALMDHPNIARVLDAGPTDSGRPYFVMDLVKGVPITQYCDEQQLTPWERLELFVPVCHAVQHAHQKGIIHRDIKPTNVLVGEYDDLAVPRIIDFGVAKAIQQPTTEKTIFTRFGQIVGTVDYMSPEQAKLNELDIDTRSDVYSLGVLLYELLTGTTPFDKKRLCEAAYDELLRIIREEEPPKPSTRISSLGHTAVTVSAQRKTEPKKLGQVLHGDLDWIVMKAMEKGRDRRYETASGFAADIKRYLNDEPVLACPPSAVYRISKFTRRNKSAMTTMGLVAASLVLGVIVSSWLAIRANMAERVARQEEQRAVDAEQTAKRQRDLARDAQRRAQEERDEKQRMLYPADMIVAQQAWDAGDVAGAMEILERHVPRENEKDLRGFHWASLRRLCTRSVTRKSMRYPERISCMALSSDGRFVAAASSVYGKMAYVWDVATGDRVDPGLAGQAVACLPNDATFAILGSSGISLWSPDTGMRENVLPYSGGAVVALACSSNGARLAAGGFDKKVHVWDLAGGGDPRVLTGSESLVFSVALSPDGRWVAAAAAPQLLVWDIEGDGQPIVLKQDINHASSVAFTDDGTTLVSAGWDGQIKLWDIATKRRRRVLRTENGAAIYSITCSSDGRLAAGAEDGSVTIWRLTDGELIDVLKGHQHMVWSVVFSRDNRVLASGSMDGEVRTWDVTNRRPPDELNHSTQQFTNVVFSPDGSVVATASTDHITRLWDVETGEQLQTLPPHRSWIHQVAVAPTGDCLASVSMDGAVRVWDLTFGTQRYLLGHFLPLAVTFSPDGQTMAVGGAEAQLHLWDVATGTHRLKCESYGKQIRALAISPNGQIIASGGWESTIMLWDLKTGKRVGTLTGHDRDVRSLAFSPDGKTLASCAGDGTVKLWDVGERKERETLAGHTATVFSIAFSPDGQILASGGGDNTVKLWYLKTDREPESLPTRSPAVSVAFSPDGDTLACASRNAVQFWRTVDVEGSKELDRRWDLQRRARAIVMASPQQQRRVLADVRSHLAAAAVKGLTLRDMILANSTVWRLEYAGLEKLAEEAFRSLVQALAISGNPKARDLADAWEATFWEHLARYRFNKHLQKANEFVEAGEPSDAIEELNLAVELQPNDSVVLRQRGQVYARLGQWEKASLDYRKLVALEPSNDSVWLHAAPLFVLADDVKGYREHCRGMLARFSQSDEAPVAERMIKASLLLPDTVETLGPWLTTLESALQPGSAPGWLRKWGYLSLALAAHRAGDARKSIECLDKVKQSPAYGDAGPEKAIVFCVAAMSLHQMGETEKASQTLAKANRLIEDHFSRVAAGDLSVEHDWLIAEILRREAVQLTSVPTGPPTSDAHAAPKHQEVSDCRKPARLQSRMCHPGSQCLIHTIQAPFCKRPEPVTDIANIIHKCDQVPAELVWTMLAIFVGCSRGHISHS